MLLASSGDIAHQIGSAVGLFLWPAAGAVLLFIGVRRRIAHRRWVRQEDQRLLGPASAVTAHQPAQQGPVPAADGALLSKPAGGGVLMIVAGVVLLAIGGLHIAARAIESGASQNSSTIVVGQCISADAYVSGPLEVTGPAPVSCDRPEATLELASKGDGTATCPDGKRQDSDYASLLSDTRTLCFVLNVQEGHCYVRTRQFWPADCADPRANMKITKRIDGDTDAACSGNAQPAVYLEPPRMYCIERP